MQGESLRDQSCLLYVGYLGDWLKSITIPGNGVDKLFIPC